MTLPMRHSYCLRFILASVIFLWSNILYAADCVVLLHGLARSASSMDKLAEALKESDFLVSNIDYPSRKFPIETLADMAIEQGIEDCRRQHATAIHFVTHSLGGILVRYYFTQHSLPELKRVVMLAPPNKGSEVVDKLRETPGFFWLNGPAGQQLGTTDKDLPGQLGPVKFELGVIAGTSSINLLLSSLIPDQDDGKVSVESTKVTGMKDFTELPTSHPFIMKNQKAVDQTVYFLKYGVFFSQ